MDIPATDLDQTIKDDQYRIIQFQFPQFAMMDDAVNSTEQLKDRLNTVAILAGELILVGKLTDRG